MSKHYQVVAGVVFCAGRVLCLRKGATDYGYTSHHWEFPGGKIEPGETPRQALRRELLEELHLEVEVGDHLLTVTHEYPDFGITVQAYKCVAANPAVQLTEHEAVRWLPPAQLCALDWCDADAPIAKCVKENVNPGPCEPGQVDITDQL